MGISRINRRTLIRGLSGFALGTLLDSCGGGSGGGAPSGSPGPQPRPNGALAPVALPLSGTPRGSCGFTFAGLSYEKSSLAPPRFTPDNTNLIGIFRRLGSSLLRLGAG